ncbi:MAG: hypothetical protein M3N53_12915 [Actinomycetota bacterium]|nr:hypothetical protein [Actinomycetota bacterium]
MGIEFVNKVPLEASRSSGDVQSYITVTNSTDTTLERGRSIFINSHGGQVRVKLDEDFDPGDQIVYRPQPFEPSGGGSVEAWYNEYHPLADDLAEVFAKKMGESKRLPKRPPPT